MSNSGVLRRQLTPLEPLVGQIESAEALDSIAQAGFSTVMNVQAALDGVKTLDEKSILAAFKDGRSHPNFLAHDYTCDGKQLAGNTAICNAYQKIKQVKGGKVTTVTSDWVTGADLYSPQK